MGWIFLILAGVFEVIGVTGLNLITRKKSVSSYLIFVAGLACSFTFLSLCDAVSADGYGLCDLDRNRYRRIRTRRDSILR